MSIDPRSLNTNHYRDHKSLISYKYFDLDQYITELINVPRFLELVIIHKKQKGSTHTNKLSWFIARRLFLPKHLSHDYIMTSYVLLLNLCGS